MGAGISNVAAPENLRRYRAPAGLRGRGMKRVLLAVSALIVLTGSEARAGFEDGNTLYRICTGIDVSQIACLGYVEGVTDYFRWIRDWQKQPQCIPNGIQTQQVQDVVV